MKLFLLTTLALGIIFVKTTLAEGSDDEEDLTGAQSEDEEQQDYDNDEQEDDNGEGNETSQEEPIFPNLICILFSSQGCNMSCTIVDNIYGTDSVGQCSEQNVCDCQPPENSSLDTLWGRKFESKVILPQIKRNPALAQQVHDILQQPLKSTEETKQELKSILSKEQFEKIRIKPRAASNTIPKPDGTFDLAAAKKYTTVKLRPHITAEFPKSIDYKKSLNDALQNSPDELYLQNLIYEIRRTRNPTLQKIADEFLTPDKAQELQLSQEEEENVIEFVSKQIINDLIKAAEAKPKSKANPAASGVHPPAKSPLLNQPSVNLNPPLVNKPPNVPPGTSQITSSTSFTDFTLPDTTINKRLIDSFQKPVDKNWSGANFQVRFKRLSPKGDTQLWWKKGNDEIYLHKHTDGAVDQNWNFGGKVYIGLYRDADKSQIQSWDFGNTRLDYEKSTTSAPHKLWYKNNRDEGSYQKYCGIIKSWCNANDFFVDKESCVIF